MSERADAWEIKDNYPGTQGRVQYSIERGNFREESHEVGAVVWDYGLACVIEAVLNLQADSAG